MIPATVTAGDTIADVLEKRPSAARILLDRRMHCVGCAIAAFETLGEACEAYGVDVDELLRELGADAAPRVGGC